MAFHGRPTVAASSIFNERCQVYLLVLHDFGFSSENEAKESLKTALSQWAKLLGRTLDQRYALQSLSYMNRSLYAAIDADWKGPEHATLLNWLLEIGFDPRIGIPARGQMDRSVIEKARDFLVQQGMPTCNP